MLSYYEPIMNITLQIADGSYLDKKRVEVHIPLSTDINFPQFL